MKKRILSIFMCMTMITATLGAGGFMMPSHAETDENGFDYIDEDESVTITGYSGTDVNIEIPESINNKPVTAISDSAFSGRAAIETAKLPDTITVIGKNAFYNCFHMTECNLPQHLEVIGEGAFGECNALSGITIPEHVSVIGKGAFDNCRALTKINIPAGVKSIGENTFKDCWKIESLTFSEGLETIGAGAFKFCDGIVTTTFPSTLKTIEKDAFADCRGITELVFNEGLESIGDNAFKSCTIMESVVFPETLTTIGSAAFEGCFKLTDISIPDSVTEIGDCCFKSIYGLKRVKLPYNLKSLGNEAFYDTNLNYIYFPPLVEYVGDNAFGSINDIYPVWVVVYIQDRNHYDEVMQFGTGIARPTDIPQTISHEVLCLEKQNFDNLSFTYDGEEHLIVPTCSTISSDAMEWDELKVTEPGTYEITVKSKEPLICYGEKKLSFDVKKKNLDENDVTITGIQDLSYTGKHLRQDITIKLGEKELTEGTDYKVYYDNNVEPGTAQMDIIFKGPYSGSIDGLAFEILPAEPDDLKISFDNSVTYSGKEQKPSVTVRTADGMLVDDSMYAVSYMNNINAGTAAAVVTFTGNYTGTREVEFEILPASSKNLKASLKTVSFVHNGKVKKPAVIVETSDGTTVPSSQYKVTYTGNKAAGTAKAAVTFTGNYKGSKTLKFTIKPAAPKVKKLLRTKKGFTAKWSKKAYTGYQLRYSTKKSMAGAKSVTIKKASVLSKKIGKLKSKKKYFVQVRAYKNVNGQKYYSKWSAKKSVKTK